MLFIELEYSIATEEAERIGVDHIAKYSNANTMVQSTVAENLNAQYSAINLLNNRINVMFEYVKCVKQNKLKKNNEILREIRSLCHRLPIIKSEKFYKQYYMVSIKKN
jgi:COP9 signalosome complex subunit 6